MYTGAERNLQILYHVRFWTTILRMSKGLLSIRTGDQTIDFSNTPAFVTQTYGIDGDNIDALKLLDEDAEIFARSEEELIDRLPDISALPDFQDEDLPTIPQDAPEEEEATE